MAGQDGFSLKGLGLKLETAEDVKSAFDKLDPAEQLEFLELEGNTLGVEAAKEVGKYLEKRPELKTALWKDLFTGRLNAEIPKALNYLFAGVELAGARLQKLELSDNAIGPVAMPGLIPFFKTHSSFSLKQIIMNNNGLGPDGGSTFADALSQCYRLSQESAGSELFQLKVFECGRNRLEDKASTRFAAFFSEIGSLEEIRMPQNGIRPDGIRELANSFRRNPNLRALSLNDNCIRADGATNLSQSLRELQNIQELNLGDCLLKNEGALKVIQALKEGSGPRSLRIINLESSEVDGQTAKAIGNYLKGFDQLKEVYLSGNEFGARFAEEISAMLTFGKNNVKVFIDDVNEDDDDESGDEVAESEDAGLSKDSGPATSWLDNSNSQIFGNPAKPPFTFAPHPQPQTNSFMTATVTLGGGEDAKVEAFLEKPTIDGFRSLTPFPWKLFIEYFKKKNPEDFPYLCVSTAIKLSNLIDTTTQDTFDHLMMEVIRKKGSNTLATVLCIYYGFIKPEDKLSPAAMPTESTIYALSRFVELSPIPVLVLQCIKEFFGPSTFVPRPAWFTASPSSSGNLIRAVDKRLSIVPSSLLISIQ